MKLDVIIPAYNEELNLPILHDTLTKTLENIKYSLIYINDGSTDSTTTILTDIYNKDKKHVKVINFSRNFGKDAAIYCGLKNSNSEYTAIIDSDMQQHPKYLLEMLNVLEKENNIDEVAMVNKYENIGIIQKFFKKSFYRIMNRLTGLKFQIGASDFRMFRSSVKKAILDMSEKNRFSKGLFSWIGFNIEYLEYNADKRLNGNSKFKFKKQISYASDGIINFSTKPLRLITIIGVLSSLFSFIYFIIVLLQTLIYGKDIPGYASLMCVILILGGLQLLVLGILGEYLSKIYIETKNRPIYLEKSSLGFDKEIL